MRSPAEQREFRRDIQGLRALAVLGVVLNHAGLDGVSGGFAGVDVFFVISGFLISDHLARRLATGRIGFADFYARRVRRILPAALVTIVLTLIASMLLIPNSLLRPHALQDAMGAAGYVPNMVFAHRGTDYFADPSPSFYQHFWSLGVEEQFYLGWPLLLLLASLLIGLIPAIRQSEERARLSLLATAVGVGVVSFGIEHWAMTSQRPYAFFSMPTRAWEFAAGALIAYLASAKGQPLLKVPVPARAAVSWLGFAAIVYSFTVFDSATSWPGTAAVLPVLGTAAVIAAGPGGTSWDATRLLSLAPLQWIGLVSYSLYLVHWPILQITQATYGYWRPLELWATVLLAAGSFPAAWAMYRWVEKPFRTAPMLQVPRRALLAAAASSVAIVAVAGGLYAVNDGGSWYVDKNAPVTTALTAPPSQVTKFVPRNLTPAIPDKMDGIEALRSPELRNGCSIFKETDLHPCHYGDSTKPLMVLIGDSMAASIQPAVEHAAEHFGYYFETQTNQGCGVNLRHSVPDQKKNVAACDTWRKKLIEHLRITKPAVVVWQQQGIPRIDYAGRSVAQVKTGMQDVLDALPTSTKLVLLADSGADAAVSAPICLTQNLDAADRCAGDPRPADSVGIKAEQQLAAANPKRVTFVDLMRYVCTAKTCPPIIGNTLVFADDHHVTAAFATLLGPALVKELRGVL